MKIGLTLNIKEYFWGSLKKLTNNFSNLTVKSLENGYVKCLWEISSLDNLKIRFSKSCFYAIRLFDISNSRLKNNSTCIMKEIQVSKFQSSISFPIPINKGFYYFEFGYRKRNGEWRRLAYQDLNFGYRIKKVIDNFKNDNWFYSKNKNHNNELSLHEVSYQFSSDKHIGGSENISYDN